MPVHFYSFCDFILLFHINCNVEAAAKVDNVGENLTLRYVHACVCKTVCLAIFVRTRWVQALKVSDPGLNGAQVIGITHVLTNSAMQVWTLFCCTFDYVQVFVFVFLPQICTSRFQLFTPEQGWQKDTLLMILTLSWLLSILMCGVTLGGVPPSDVQYIETYLE